MGLGEWIEVGGRARPTRNSEGHLIAVTEEGVRNFWLWFGDSKLVDAEGRPLVVYHGTTGDFEKFNMVFSGSDGVGYDVPAIFATTDQLLASDYALNKFDREVADAMRAMQQFKNEAPGVYDDEYERRFQAVKDAFANQRKERRPELGGGANVIPLYMRGDMAEVDANGLRFMAIMPKALSEAMTRGEDGVIVNDVIDNASPATDYPARVFVSFSPENVKSAIGNSGKFSVESPSILLQPAFHGSPHRDIGRFTTDRVGTGEGSQAFGWGLYFAERREIAEWYRTSLSRAEVLIDGVPFLYDMDDMGAENIAMGAVASEGSVEGAIKGLDAALDDESLWGPSSQYHGLREAYISALRLLKLNSHRIDVTQGQLYHVEIPEDNELLLWDKGLAEQPQSVIRALSDAQWDHHGIVGYWMDASSSNPAYDGADLYKRLAGTLGGDRAASEYLSQIGIKGIKYLNGVSRSAGEGGYNFVIFSGDEVAIRDRLYQRADTPRGSYSPSEVLMTLGHSADRSTFIHESGHYFLEVLSDLAGQPGAPDDIVNDFNAFLKWAGVASLADSGGGDGDVLGSPVLHQFAGIHAKTADNEALVRAQERLSKGEPVERVRRETGWFEGVDGRWRFEIPDDEAAFRCKPIDSAQEVGLQIRENCSIAPDVATPGLFKAAYGEGEDYCGAWGRTPESAFESLVNAILRRRNKDAFDLSRVKVGDQFRLSLVLDHPKLFEAYPDLAALQVRFVESGDYRGAYFEDDDRFEIGLTSDHEQMLSTLLHEIQHAIQARERFARGGWTQGNFIEAVKSSLERMSVRARDDVNFWKAENAQSVVDADETARMARYALMWQSAERLVSYANRDRPSGVRRLIINELQWIYGDEFRADEDARELQRKLYGVPKAHRSVERNQYLSAVAREAAQIIRRHIPEGVREGFKSDPRSSDRLVASLRRMAEKKRAVLRPLVDLQITATVADRLKGAHEHSGPYEIYRALAGEVEARNTQARQKMTAAERSGVNPAMTADVGDDRIIVMFGSMQVHPPVSAFRRNGGAYFQGDREVRGQSLGAQFASGNAKSPIELWNSMTLDQKRPFHEKWAEAFEGYLMEGRAPAKELVPLFRRFSNWLRGVYGSLQGFLQGRNVKLSSDIRDVFDRLFAVDCVGQSAVENLVVSQLNSDTRLDGEVKSAYAQMHSTVFAGLAARTGMTSEELWGRYGLKIRVNQGVCRSPSGEAIQEVDYGHDDRPGCA